MWWLPVMVAGGILLYNVLDGLLKRGLYEGLLRGVNYSLPMLGFFFLLHYGTHGLIPLLTKSPPSILIVNWFEIITYLSIVILVMIAGSKRWLLHPSEFDAIEIKRHINDLAKESNVRNRQLKSLEEWVKKAVKEKPSQQVERPELEMGREEVRRIINRTTSEIAERTVNEAVERIMKKVSELVEGKISIAEGLGYQDESEKFFLILGFEVENHPGHGKPDHVLYVDGAPVAVVAVKSWALGGRNRTMTTDRLISEVEKAREFNVPLILNFQNKDNKRNWFKVFEPKKLTDDLRETTPKWLRLKELSESQERDMMENYRCFHKFIDGLLKG